MSRIVVFINAMAVFFTSLLLVNCDDDEGRPPQSPSNLKSSEVTVNSVTLSWSDNSDNEKGFSIERASGASSSYTEVGKVSANVKTFTQNGLSSGSSFKYRVRAFNDHGPSGYSNTVNVVTPVAVPDAPTNLVASSASASQINLSWSDNADNETGYHIERAPGGTTTFTLVATADANVTTYQNSGLTEKTTYIYRVQAFNSGGNSGYSNTSTATTGVALPSAPTDLSAVAVSASQINLTWIDNSTNEQGFKIERAPGATNAFTEIATVGANVKTYQNTGLTASTTYTYRVRAYNAGGNSDYSNNAGATTAAATPAAPGNLSGAAASASQINLSWTDNANNETGFKIERAPGGTTSFTQIAAVGANVTTYQNTGLTTNTTYVYRVRAYNAVGNSAYSNTTTVTTSQGAPAKPTNLVAMAASTSQINLSWTDNSSNENGFEIQRAPGGTTSFTLIGSVGANVKSYNDTGLSSGTSYTYRVRANNLAGNSDFSNSATATTQAATTTLTVYATEDNTLIYNTTNSNHANTVFNNGTLECGCNFSVLPYGTEFLCGSIAIKFGTLQSQINGKSIISAKLVLYVDYLPANTQTTFAVNAFAGSWSTASITYNNQPQYYINNQVNFTPPSTAVFPVELNITQIVRNWANGSFSNYGLLIRDLVSVLPPISYLRSTGFESLEAYSSSTRRPKIVVEVQ